MFRQVSLTTLIRPLLFLAILFVAMVLYLSERQNAIDRQVRLISFRFYVKWLHSAIIYDNLFVG